MPTYTKSQSSDSLVSSRNVLHQDAWLPVHATHVNTKQLKTRIICNISDCHRYHRLSGLSSLKASCEIQGWQTATQNRLFMKNTGFLWIRNWGKLQHGPETRTGHHILIAIEVNHWVRLQTCHTLRDLIQLCLPQRCLPRLCLGNVGLRCRETYRSCCQQHR